MTIFHKKVSKRSTKGESLVDTQRHKGMSHQISLSTSMLDRQILVPVNKVQKAKNKTCIRMRGVNIFLQNGH